MKSDLRAIRVLIVEDDGLIRLMVADALRDEGFEVVEAWNGDEAAKLIDKLDGFDALFTDVQMPGTLDGIDVAVHARQRHPAIPVLIASGFAARLVSRLGTLQPSAVFIGKPYAPGEIIAALRRLTLKP